MAQTQRVCDGNTVTWTVVSKTFSVVEPVEDYLEFGRQVGFSPNTVRAYARGLALWWTYLEYLGKQWDSVDIQDFGTFLSAVRHDEFDPVVRSLEPGC